MREYKETDHSLLYKSNSDFIFYSAGHEACHPSQGYGPRVRAYHVIHFVLAGQGTLQINEQTFSVHAGDAFLIPAGQVSYYEADKEDPWTYIWINFLGIQSKNYLYRIMRAAEEHFVIRRLPVERYREAVFELLSIQEDTTSSFFAANSILLRIMSYLFADISFQEKEWGQLNAADRVRFYLDMNYSKNLRLKDVALHFGYHPHYVTRIFNERFGIGPKQYLMNLKLKKACSLLRSTRLTVTVIAESLGFEDVLAFSRTFKKTFGVSPTDYRKEQQQ